MFVNTETSEFGLAEGDVRTYFAQAGTVMIWGDPFLPMLPFVAVTQTEKPAHNPATHKAVEVAPIEAEGSYLQKWKVVKLTSTELDQIEAERLAAEQVAKDAARVIVTKRQALLAMFDLKGIRDDQIDALINAIPDEDTRYRAKVDWAGSAAIESDSPTVLMLAAALELSEADLAALFDYARTL